MDLKVIINGLLTGLFFQFAVGPVFFFIVNLTLQKSIYDGFAAVLAVTLGDYFYVTLALLGIGKLLEEKRTKRLFGIVSSIVLIIFGAFILRGVINKGIVASTTIESSSIISSFLSVFFLTLASPLTIVLFVGLFAAKAIEHKYTKKQLIAFGLAVGSATFIFMSSTVIIFSILKGAIPIKVIQTLNLIVGIALIGYGAVRFMKVLRAKNKSLKIAL